MRTIPGEPSTEALFERLFGDEEHAFWLDSADAPTRLAQSSYLGTSAGPDRCVLEYDVEAGAVHVHGAGGDATERGSIFDVLDRELAQAHRSSDPERPGARTCWAASSATSATSCKADCGATNVHRSDVPDAVLMLANRLIAVDHVRHRTHLIALCRGDEAEAERWLDEAEAAVREVLADPPAEPAPPTRPSASPATPTSASECGRGREQYLADIARSQAELAAGESYEVCLTDQISTDASPDPFDLYRNLRRSNPAPFAAYLKLGEVAVVSSSPERFLSVDRERRVEARPIKGTTSRSADPARGRGAEGRADQRRKDLRRAPDDRRPAAQRPRHRLRGRQRRRPRADGRRGLRDGAPADLDGRGRARRPTAARSNAPAPASRAAR